MEQQLRLENMAWAAATVVFILATSYAIGLLAMLVGKLLRWSEQEQRKAFWGFFFAGPWISGFFIFVLGPSLASLYYSFTDYRIGKDFEWIGLDNYRTLLLGEGAHGRRFNQALFNSFYYALIGVPLQILAALGMAMLLNREIAGIRVFRTTFYLPVILAGSPAALLAWRYMFSANGGFVNVSLQKFADSFFVFDYIYRFFIYFTESFNGFYSGITRDDSVGGLQFALPAAIGVALLLSLVGEWTEGKRQWAWRSAQILGLIVLGFTVPKGLVAATINPSWTLFAGSVALIMILINAQEGQPTQARVWQIGALSLFALSFILTLREMNSDSTLYLLFMVIAAAPVVATFFGAWLPLKFRAFWGVAVLLIAMMVIRAVPGQLDGEKFRIIPSYLTFSSTLDEIDTDNLKFETPEGEFDRDQYRDAVAYLDEKYPLTLPSSMWIYGAVTAALIGIAVLKDNRVRQYAIYGALAVFTVFALSAFKDGQAYFNTYTEMAQVNEQPNYHFALFHQSADDFPTNERVPLWMNNELWSKPSLILITMWSSGAGMLIFLAALKGVPGILYEAAAIDGANNWQKFFKITLPLISPAMFYNIVIGVIAALQTFDAVYIIRTEETEDSLASAAFFLFTRTFRQLEIGEGSAASWILAAIILTLTVLQFRWSKWVHYEV